MSLFNRRRTFKLRRREVHDGGCCCFVHRVLVVVGGDVIPEPVREKESRVLTVTSGRVWDTHSE